VSGPAAGAVTTLPLLLTVAPSAFVGLFGIFALACVVGYYVVWNVTHALHTPLMSVTNADLLSNWDGFTRLGFPNAVLNAAGFAGGIKGLPIFASTEYTDGYAQVVNRELVAHRVYQPMQIFGPFPSYDSNGNLIGADQYYNEEFNGSIVPVVEKTAHMVIA
jgi:hypothetical protein